MSLLLRTLRGDFTLVENYHYSAVRTLSCQLTAFGGREDPHIGRAELLGWSRETSGRFDLHLLPGGHFFLQDSRKLLLALIGRKLAATTPHAE